MSELINALGLDWKMLVAQLVNFGILVAVLYFFAYKPLLKVLRKRSQMIADSLDKTEKIDKLLAKTKEDYKAKLAAAQEQSQEILSKSKQEAEKYRLESITKTQEQIEAMVAQSRTALQAEKDLLLDDIKKDVADLVVTASKKVIGREIKPADNDKLIDETISHIKK